MPANLPGERTCQLCVSAPEPGNSSSSDDDLCIPVHDIMLNDSGSLHI